MYLSHFIFISVKNAKNILAIAEYGRNGIELSTVTLQDFRQTKCHNMDLNSKDVTNTCLKQILISYQE